MVGAVTLARRAFVARLIFGIGAFERAKAYGRQQFLLDNPNHRLLLLPIEKTVGQACGDNLVRTKFFHRVIFGEHVIQATPLRIPELRAKTVADEHCFRAISLRRGIAQLSGPRRRKGEGSVPERVDLNRFAVAWRYDPIAHLGVHPRKLRTRSARSQEMIVGVHTDRIPGAALVPGYDLPRGGIERVPQERPITAGL